MLVRQWILNHFHTTYNHHDFNEHLWKSSVTLLGSNNHWHYTIYFLNLSYAKNSVKESQQPHTQATMCVDKKCTELIIMIFINLCMWCHYNQIDLWMLTVGQKHERPFASALFLYMIFQCPSSTNEAYENAPWIFFLGCLIVCLCAYVWVCACWRYYEGYLHSVRFNELMMISGGGGVWVPVVFTARERHMWDEMCT